MERRLHVCACGQENFSGTRRGIKNAATKLRDNAAMIVRPKLSPPARRGRPPALTASQVDEARRLHLAGLKDPAIAMRFGVCAAVISKARRGKGGYNGHRA